MTRALTMGLFVGFVAGCTEYEMHNSADHDAGLSTDDPPDENADAIPLPDAPVYANTSTELFEVVPDTGAVERVGAFNGEATESFVDIAIDLEGRVFGGTYDGLYRLNPATAEAASVCTPDVDMTALAFASDGTLFAGGADGISRIDVDSCGVTALVDDSYETSGDIVGLPDGYLYWTVRGEDTDELVRVDPENGATEWIGEIGVKKLFGVGYDKNELYGFSSEGVIVRISPSVAGGDVVTVDDSRSWWGATTNPVVW